MSSPPESNFKNSQLKTHVKLPAATIPRIIGAWLYDFLLLCTVWLVAGIVYIIPAQFFLEVDSNQVQNLSSTQFTGPIYYFYMFFITWYFFAWFWIHGGQTLGLRSWSLKVQTPAGQPLTWIMTLIRFVVAGSPWLIALFVYDQLTNTFKINSGYVYFSFLLGFVGLLPILIDKRQRSLQDIISKTQIVKLPKQKKNKS